MKPTLSTADRLTLKLREWPVAGPNGDASGTVLIVHGLGEHIGRYAHVAAQLNSAGWHVVGFDQRGHGASDGARGALAAGDSLLSDLALVIDAVRAAGHANQRGPLLLLGHSMGGLVAARFCAEGLAATPAPWCRAVNALVLSSPALDPGMNAVQKGLLAVLGGLAPNLAVGNGLKPAWISRDPAVVKAYEDDPLVHDRVTPRLVRFIVDAGRQTLALAARWQLPTLLLYAGSDRCVAPAGSAAFAQAAPTTLLTVRRFEPLFHEIFNEPEQAEVFDALTAWLAKVNKLSVRP
jgi:alpha-beta hydrolase superfamily lysophospholipase